MNSQAVALGLDFGTESVRALFVDAEGIERATATAAYSHGQIVDRLPATGERLPVDFALQHPSDWMDAAVRAVRDGMKLGELSPGQIVGIGVDFTSCTMLPAKGDGTPLCLTPEMAGEKYAWPKLWKHHAAKSETDRFNAVARDRKEAWLDRYGGIIGLEWFFPKVYETLRGAPAAYQAADVWLEAGDWFVWQLVGGPASELPRSTCQAGYKGLWNADTGYPSREFFGAIDPRLEEVIADKMHGRLVAPGTAVGGLLPAVAEAMGLRSGTPVSAAIIDAHAAVPGVGAGSAGAMVMVLGTSSCHMLNALVEQSVPGVAGIVRDGILPGLVGYETGQAAVGDAFDWVRRLAGQPDFSQLTAAAQSMSPGSEGVSCVDWFNGCRTPLMDGGLAGQFRGLTLNHGAPHLYHALLEATAFGLRWIVELLREHKVPVSRLVATGGLPHHNPLLVPTYASVLGEPVEVHFSRQGPALGSAILGMLAAGADSPFATAGEAIEAMAAPRAGDPKRQSRLVEPNSEHVAAYDRLYRNYRCEAEELRLAHGPLTDGRRAKEAS